MQVENLSGTLARQLEGLVTVAGLPVDLRRQRNCIAGDVLGTSSAGQRKLGGRYDLRNAIVHEDRDGALIAEAHVEAVRDLDRIAQLVSDPPKIGTHFAKQVVTASADQRVGIAARVMYDGRFSQLPVYASDTFVVPVNRRDGDALGRCPV